MLKYLQTVKANPNTLDEVNLRKIVLSTMIFRAKLGATSAKTPLVSKGSFLMYWVVSH